MTSQNSTTDNCILEPLPDNIHAAILTYANESSLTPRAVVEGALQYFPELDASLSNKAVSVTDGRILLAGLPLVLQSRAKQYAQNNEMPYEFVIELAIAHFLDPDSVTCDDC